MFSRRLPASLEANRISRALEAARARGPLIDLTETNPTRVGLRYPEREILDALAQPGALAYQPDPRGLLSARRAVAGYYAERGATVSPERLFLTASTSESYSLLFQLLCDPGDRVLVPEPSYPLFELLARLAAVEIAPYPLRYHAGWYLDIEELEQKLDDRTRAVLVVNPNNPTGSFLKRGELDRLERLCAERSLAIVSDEVFADNWFAPDPDRVPTLAPGPAGQRRALTFCLSGLSKLCGLPQLKLGWIVAAGPDELVREAEARLELIADTYLSVSTPVQEAAPRLVALISDVGAQLALRVRTARAELAARVSGTALQLLDAEGGWSAILRVPRTRSEEEWVLQLLDDGVVVHPGFFFDMPEEAHLVVSLIAKPEDFREGIERLIARVHAGL